MEWIVKKDLYLVMDGGGWGMGRSDSKLCIVIRLKYFLDVVRGKLT